MNTSTSCRSCHNAFDSDLNLRNSPNNRLPVSCQNCPYSVCHCCFRGWSQTWRRSQQKSSSLMCPQCHVSDGFDTFEPNICPFACLLIEHAQTKPASTTASSSPTTAAPAAMTPPKRKATQSTRGQKPLSVVKKPRKAPTKTKEQLVIGVLSDQELEALRTADPELWLKDMQLWLEHVDGVSKDNLSRVMGKVKELVKGAGLSIKQWPQDVVFMIGVNVDLSMDFDQMLQDAKAQELKYGQDKGNGWAMRHPINKLGRYQRYVVVEKLRKSVEWPLRDDDVPPARAAAATTTSDPSDDETEEEPTISPLYHSKPGLLVGTKIYKNFGFHGWFWGRITKYDRTTGFHVYYEEDDDEEDLTMEEITPWVAAAEQCKGNKHLYPDREGAASRSSSISF